MAYRNIEARQAFPVVAIGFHIRIWSTAGWYCRPLGMRARRGCFSRFWNAGQMPHIFVAAGRKVFLVAARNPARYLCLRRLILRGV
jgi:hypothetical protein